MFVPGPSRAKVRDGLYEGRSRTLLVQQPHPADVVELGVIDCHVAVALYPAYHVREAFENGGPLLLRTSR